MMNNSELFTSKYVKSNTVRCYPKKNNISVKSTFNNERSYDCKSDANSDVIVKAKCERKAA